MTRRSRFASVAIALLAIATFGGLSVGVPLVYAQLTIPEVAGQELGVSVVPAIALIYGLVSLAGTIGMWRRRRWATPLVVVSQGFVALALIVLYGAFADWSLLFIAAIAGGAALCALADARRAVDAESLADDPTNKRG
jgi:hypothetical protein